MKMLSILLISLGLILTSCKKKDGHGHSHSDGHGHDHGDHGHVHGPHDGDVLPINGKNKDNGYIEVLLNEKTGTMTVYVLGSDMKSAVAIKKAPQFTAKVEGKRTAFDFKADKLPASKFSLTDKVFQMHLDGNILIKLDDVETAFNVFIPHHH